MREASTLHSPPSTELSKFSDSPSHQTEARLAALVGGAALVVLAARDRSWRGVGLALAGAPLVWRGATGNWPVHLNADVAAESVPAPIEVSVTIAKSPEELFRFWRRLENLPRFMRHLESVQEIGNGRSHWVAKSPVGGMRVEWEAEIVDEREGRFLSWQSLPGSRVHNAGSVFFEKDGDRGTVVRVQMEAAPSGLGGAVGRLLAPVTSRQVQEDLRRFKSLMETGEIPTTEGQPVGRRSLINPKNPF